MGKGVLDTDTLSAIMRQDAIAIDHAQAYLSSCLSQAIHVFDRFHVMKLYNEKLSQLRRDLQREATDGPMKKAIKGTR